MLTGMGVAMLLGAAATADFILRYLVPVVPLLVAGGVVAASALFTSRREQGRHELLRRPLDPRPRRDHRRADEP